MTTERDTLKCDTLKCVTLKCDTLLFSDPGADIDDEVAIWWALNQGKSFTLCIGGRGKLDSLNTFLDGFETEGTIEKSFDLGKIPEDLVIVPKNIILIAPGIDSVIDRFDFSQLVKVSYQGNNPVAQKRGETVITDDTVGFNDNGSQNFFSMLPDNVEVNCVTSKECNMPENLFSEHMFLTHKFPEKISQTVRETVFKNMIGRMDPNHTYNKFAEGLINPDIKGANYHLVNQIFNASKKSIGEPSEQLKKAVKDYITTIPSKSDKSEEYLLDMSNKISVIIGTDPIEGGKLITSNDSYKLHIKYSDGFKSFCSLGIYSPAFDLVTTIKHFS